jgi:hypothetical protein
VIWQKLEAEYFCEEGWTNHLPIAHAPTPVSGPIAA